MLGKHRKKVGSGIEPFVLWETLIQELGGLEMIDMRRIELGLGKSKKKLALSSKIVALSFCFVLAFLICIRDITCP
jgi:hypothetical protein